MKPKIKKEISIINRKASFLYETIEEYEAGIILFGTEIKSIRAGGVSFSDSYCYIKEGEIFVKNLHIAEYKNASFNQHEPKRDRKLLLNKREIRKLKEKMMEKGLTIVPSKLFINARGLAKVVVVLAKGKNLKSKRDTLRERDLDREIRDNS